MQFSFLTFNSVSVALVGLFMLRMRVPVMKGGWKMIGQNAAFWIYAGYWIPTIGTAIRLAFWNKQMQDQSIMLPLTIVFCCLGGLIVTLSTASPLALILQITKSGTIGGGKPAIPRTNTAVESLQSIHHPYCVYILTLYLVALAASLAVVEQEVASLKTVLLGWRIWFFASVSVEITLVCVSLHLVNRLTRISHLHSSTSVKGIDAISKGAPTCGPNCFHQKLRRHLMITLFIRFGITAVIILKLSNALAQEVYVLIHIWLILIALIAYSVSHNKSKHSHTPSVKFLQPDTPVEKLSPVRRDSVKGPNMPVDDHNAIIATAARTSSGALLGSAEPQRKRTTSAFSSYSINI
eukprot:c8150_g1_i2.p1 GENE.c8150_g1_i2~~c8150_g1_i2.p1  ORF type:complete len:351 (-),score=55.61 c8150_g1_i2:299-1351(-)